MVNLGMVNLHGSFCLLASWNNDVVGGVELMNTRSMFVMLAFASLAIAFAASVSTTFAGAQNSKGANPLSGTSWQLVKFQGDDERTFTPDDKSKYTIKFGSNGRVTARVDCN